jgi:hypothetical protein
VDGLLLLAGAGLRILQYLANRSLWIDEAALATILLHPTAGGVTEGLDPYQVAPPGFQWAVRAAVALLGASELALRLFPLLCSLAALVLFQRLARRALDPGTASYALAFFAFNRWLVFYASDLKQYSSDVLIATVLLLSALTMVQEPPAPSRAVRFALVGAVAGLFSHAALLVAFGIFMAALLAPMPKAAPSARRSLVAVALVWTAGASLSVLWSFRTVPPVSRAGLTIYWKRLDGLPASPAAAPRWAVRALAEAFAFLFDPFFHRHVLLFGGVVLALAAVGVARFFRKRPAEAALLVGPLASALGAGAIQRYPFAGRLILSLFPSMLILLAAAFAGPWSSPVRSRWAYAGASVLAAAFAVRTLSIVPEHFEEMRSVVARLRSVAAPGDGFWVYSSAEKALRYYSGRSGFKATNVRIGCRAFSGWPHYVDQVQSVAGAGRIWVILSHLPDADADFIRRCFDVFGDRQTEILDRGASATLYVMRGSPRSDVQTLRDSIPEAERHGVLDSRCTLGTSISVP